MRRVLTALLLAVLVAAGTQRSPALRLPVFRPRFLDAPNLLNGRDNDDEFLDDQY